MTNSSFTGQQLELTEEFTKALELLRNGSHLFLTGKAGTGKSTLIRVFTQESKRSMVVAAPMGISALNVDCRQARVPGLDTTGSERCGSCP